MGSRGQRDAGGGGGAGEPGFTRALAIVRSLGAADAQAVPRGIGGRKSKAARLAMDSGAITCAPPQNPRRVPTLPSVGPGGGCLPERQSDHKGEEVDRCEIGALRRTDAEGEPIGLSRARWAACGYDGFHTAIRLRSKVSPFERVLGGDPEAARDCRIVRWPRGAGKLRYERANEAHVDDGNVCIAAFSRGHWRGAKRDGGEGGIRTPGRLLHLQRFSKAPLSATQPPLPKPRRRQTAPEQSARGISLPGAEAPKSTIRRDLSPRSFTRLNPRLRRCGRTPRGTR